MLHPALFKSVSSVSESAIVMLIVCTGIICKVERAIHWYQYRLVHASRTRERDSEECYKITPGLEKARRARAQTTRRT